MLLLYLFQVFLLLFSFSSWIPSCLWHTFCDCPTLFEHSNFLVYSFCILAREVPSDFSSCSLICFLATSRLLVHLSVSYLFAFSLLFMGFSRQEYWSGLPSPSPLDHNLSELSTMTCPSCVALHSMAHSFKELHKGMVRVISVVSFLWLWFSFCLPSNG